jgi:hypothetical protein
MEPRTLVVNVLADESPLQSKYSFLNLASDAKVRIVTIESGESLDWIKKNLPKIALDRYPGKIIVASYIPVPKGYVVMEVTKNRRGAQGLNYSHQVAEPEEELSGSAEEYDADVIAKIGQLTVDRLRLHDQMNALDEQKRDLAERIRTIDNSITDLYRRLGS